VIGSVPGKTTGLDRVAAAVAQITADHIELVELAIFPDYLIVVGWSSLAKVFAKPQFPAFA
jgi:hypothetical protein